MGATVKLDDLLPEQDEHFQSEVYANNNSKQAYQRGMTGQIAPPPVIPSMKSLDDKHWLNNLPQPVNESGRGNENEETRMNNQNSARGAANNQVRTTYGGENNARQGGY